MTRSRAARRGTSVSTLRASLGSSFLRSGLSFPLSLLLIPLTLRFIGVRDYGVWVTLSSLMALGGLADAGLRVELSRRVAQAQGAGRLDDIPRILSEGVTLLVLLAGSLTGGLLLAANVVVSTLFPELDGAARNEAVWLLRGLAILLFLQLVGGGYFAALPGLQRRDLENYAGLLGLVTGSLATVVGLLLDLGLAALLYGLAANITAGCAVQAMAMRRLVPSRVRLIRLTWPATQGLLSISAFLLVVQVANLFDAQVDKILLSLFVGADAAAEYQLGATLATNIRFVALVPATLLLAGLAELAVRDPVQERVLFEVVNRVTCAVAALGFGAVVAFAEVFVELWLGPGYTRAVLAAEVLSIAMYINVVSAPLYFHLVARGQHRKVAISALIVGLSNGLCSLLLVRTLGFEGVLYGSLFGNALGTACLLLFVRADDASRVRLRAVAVATAAGFPTALLLREQLRDVDVGVLDLLLVGGAYVTAAVVLLVLLRVLRVNEVRRVLQRR